MGIFNQYAEYYNLFYQDKDYANEVAYVCSLIEEFRPGSSSLLELGCGSGKHAPDFAENGFNVFGVDQSAEMIAQANLLKQSLPENLQSRLNFEVADITELEIKDSVDQASNRKWDVAVSLFHVVSYLTTNEKLLAMFKKVCDHLNPGGLMIFDCWYGPGVLTTLPENRERALENESISVVRKAAPVMKVEANVVEVNYCIEISDKSNGVERVVNEVHAMRYFFEPEIALMLKASGLKLRECHEWASRKPASVDSWYVTFIAEKI